MYKCKLCGKKFNSQYSAKKHNCSVRENNESRDIQNDFFNLGIGTSIGSSIDNSDIGGFTSPDTGSSSNDFGGGDFGGGGAGGEW